MKKKGEVRVMVTGIGNIADYNMDYNECGILTCHSSSTTGDTSRWAGSKYQPSVARRPALHLHVPGVDVRMPGLARPLWDCHVSTTTRNPAVVL